MPWRWPFTRVEEKATQVAPHFRMEEKVSQVAALFSTPGRAVWPGRNVEQYGREGYQQNVIAFRCVNLITQACAAVPMCLYDERDKEIEQHKMLDLIRSPNPMTDGNFFTTSALASLVITGNMYLEAVYGVGKVPVELYVLRPDRTKIISGTDGWPTGYSYAAGGIEKTIDITQDMQAKRPLSVLHVKSYHPLDDWYGMSPMDPAAYSIDVHASASQFSKALLDNSATPSGALMVKLDKEGQGTLTTEQADDLRNELDARFVGRKNVGRPMVLQGGLEWHQFGMNLVDMEMIELKRDSARDICMAFGVPPMLMGIPGDNTYSNYKEANHAFFRQVVVPTIGRYCDALSGWLSPAFDQRLRLIPDLDEVPALTEEREALWRRVNESKILTINEKREAIGYGPTEGGDVVLVSSSDIPLSEAALTEDDPEEDPEDDPEEPEKDPKEPTPPKPKPEDETEDEDE